MGAPPCAEVNTRALRLQVSSLKPDNFDATIVKETPDYLYAEFTSPTFGFIDDVEFFFTGEHPSAAFQREIHMLECSYKSIY